MIVCGDFCQLSSVKGSPVSSSAISIKGFLALALWMKFQMVLLTDVMRQRGDYDFMRILDKIRKRKH